MRRPDAGFTVVEILIATAIMLAVTGAIFGVIRPAQATFHAQPEISDMHQRLRVAVDAMAKDLVMAGAGLAPASVAPVMPYRIGDENSDPDFGVFYRPDAITATYTPWGATAAESHTYYLASDLATGTSQLMHYDGRQTDLPVVDHVVKLQFEYFDGEAVLDPVALQDGPWMPEDAALTRFDADLLHIRRVRVHLRVEAAFDSMRGPAGALFARGGTSTSMERFIPDQELQFDVAVRSLNRDR